MPKFEINSNLLPLNKIEVVNQDIGFKTNTNAKIHILNLANYKIVNDYLRILFINGF